MAYLRLHGTEVPINIGKGLIDMKTVGDKLEAFSVTGVKPGFNQHEEKGQSAFETITENSFPGKWKVIYFYPKDFTFVCPTEITGYAKLNKQFEERDAVLLSGSTDNEFSKLGWRREHADLKGAACHVHRRSGEHDPARDGQQPERRSQPRRDAARPGRPADGRTVPVQPFGRRGNAEVRM
jgi:hypothetical protein